MNVVMDGDWNAPEPMQAADRCGGCHLKAGE
jgi:hypothetical protein